VTTSRQRGLTVVIVGLLASSMLVMTLFAGDVGALMFRKSLMQNAADSGALAGAYSLTGGVTAAKAAARDLATKNGFAITTGRVSVSGDDVTVAWSQPESLLVGKVLGLAAVQIDVTATARRVVRRYGSRPFGLPDDAFVPGQIYTVKQGTGDVSSGNFYPLALGGNGADIYLDGIKYGTRPPVKIGDIAPTEPGNVAGPTKTGVDYVVSSGIPEIVVPLLKPGAYTTLNGKSAVEVIGLAIFKVKGMSGSAVQAEFVRRITDYSEIPGTLFGSRLIG